MLASTSTWLASRLSVVTNGGRDPAPVSRSRTIAHAALVLALLVLGGFVTTAVVYADTYVTTMSVSNDQPTPGATVTVTGGGFSPNKPTEVLFDSTPIGSTTANANGTATTAIVIPVGATSGDHIIVLARQGAEDGSIRCRRR